MVRSLLRVPPLVALLLAAAAPVRAQTITTDDVRLSLGGLLQAEAAYGVQVREGDDRERVGFGLRRARLRTTAEVGPRAGATLQVEGDDGTVTMLDVFAFYELTPRLGLRLGRFAGAPPYALIPTPVMAIDGTERAAIAALWNRGTIGAKGRDFGVEARYEGERTEIALFLHNGDGSYGNLRGDFAPNVTGDVTSGRDRGLDDLAVSASAAYRPAGVEGLQVGGYAGYNGSRNPNTAAGELGRRYVSWSAHAYLGALPFSRPVRLKADVIAVRYEERGAVPVESTFGASLLGAVAVGEAVELYARAETYEAEGDRADARYVAAGVSFSPSRLRGEPFVRQRLLAGYTGRFAPGDAPDGHGVVVQAQVFF